MTELGISQQSTEVFLPTALDESSISEDEITILNRHGYIKNLLSLAAVGVIAFTGTYSIQVDPRPDATYEMVFTSENDTISGYSFDLPSPKVANLFANLAESEELNKYYREASFFEMSDLTDS